MPEPTEDKQDIGQLVAQTDELVSKLETELAAITQAASDDGPVIESQEWTPPPEPVEPAATPSATDEEAQAESPAKEEVETETESVEEPIAEAPSNGNENRDNINESGVDEQEGTAEADTTEIPVAESKSDEPPDQEADETPSAEEPLPEPVGASADATTEPIEAHAASESAQGGDVCFDDALDNEGEAVCVVESADSAIEEPGDILMDEAAIEPASAEPELFADATKAKPEPTAEASARVRSLDDELARLADEMIDGEDDEPGVLLDGPEADSANQPENDEEADDVAAPTAESPEPARATSLESKPEVDHATASTRPDDLKERVWFYAKIGAQRTAEVARERGPIIAARVEPIARQACEQATKPLDKQKPIVKQAIGWVAVSTAMYASLVLFYVAFLRKPPMIEPDAPGTTLVDDSGRSIASHPGN